MVMQLKHSRRRSCSQATAAGAGPDEIRGSLRSFKGSYVFADAWEAGLILIASGSELSLAVEAH